MMKKGVSPVIATVLLIGLTIAIGTTIFLGAKKMQQKTILVEGENAGLACDTVSFEATYSDERIYLSNTGNIPLHNFKIKISKGSAYETEYIDQITSDWGDGIEGGGGFSSDIDLDFDVEKIVLIPILLGDSEGGKETFECPEWDGLLIDI